MNWNKLFWNTLAIFLGSLTCYLWLPPIQVLSLFVAITIAHIIVEFIYYLISKFK